MVSQCQLVCFGLFVATFKGERVYKKSQQESLWL